MTFINKTLLDWEKDNRLGGKSADGDGDFSIKIASSFGGDANAIVLCDDVLKACEGLKNETFQLIVSSPPYNIGKSYEKQVALEQYLDWQSQVASELVRLLLPQGSLVWQVGNYVDEGEVYPWTSIFIPFSKG